MCGQTPSEIYIKPLVLNGTLCALSFASVILMWTKHFIYIIHRFIYRSTEVSRCILFVQFLCIHIKYFPMISNDLWWFSNSLSLILFPLSSMPFVVISSFLNIAFFFKFHTFYSNNQTMKWFLLFLALGKHQKWQQQQPWYKNHHFIFEIQKFEWEKLNTHACNIKHCIPSENVGC